MNIVIINRKGGVSKSTLSLWLMRDFNRTGTPTTLVSTDIFYKDVKDNNNIINSPTNAEIDKILASKTTAIFDTGGIISPITDALSEMCDIVLIPTSLQGMETREIQHLLDRIKTFKTPAKIIIVPTRIHHATSSKHIVDALKEFNVSVAPSMTYRVGYANDGRCVKCEAEIKEIVKFIKEVHNG